MQLAKKCLYMQHDENDYLNSLASLSVVEKIHSNKFQQQLILKLSTN
jgi:hypothetical protein